MSDEYGLQGINGLEAIDYFVAKFRKALEADCNLRPQDSYSRGCSMKLSYKVSLYGLDVVDIEGEIEVGKEQEDPDAEVIEGELDIPQEEDVEEIRAENRRNAAGAPDQDVDGDEEEEGSITAPQAIAAKRKYTRKLKLASPGVIGGAEEFTE